MPYHTIFRILVLLAVLIFCLPTRGADSPPATSELDPTAPGALREGAEVADLQGEFQRVGNRFQFRPYDLDVQLTCLENLALDRVSRVHDETRSSRTWTVHGTLTEQQGTFFILLSRAIISEKRSARP